MTCLIASLLKSRISNFKSIIKVGPAGRFLFIILRYFPHPYSHAHEHFVEPWTDFSLDPPLAYSFVYKYDFIGVVETHLNDGDDRSRLKLDGYSYKKATTHLTSKGEALPCMQGRRDRGGVGGCYTPQ